MVLGEVAVSCERGTSVEELSSPKESVLTLPKRKFSHSTKVVGDEPYPPPSLSRSGGMQLKSSRSTSKSSIFRLKSSRFGSNLVDSGPNLVDSGSNLVDSFPNLVNSGSNLLDSGSNLVDSGSNLANSGQI